MSAEERIKLLDTITELAKANERMTATLARLLSEAPPAPPEPTEEEQEIIDLLQDGSVMTGDKISSLLTDTINNGTFKRLLAEMVRKGLLTNKKPGYALP